MKYAGNNLATRGRRKQGLGAPGMDPLAVEGGNGNSAITVLDDGSSSDLSAVPPALQPFNQPVATPLPVTTAPVRSMPVRPQPIRKGGVVAVPPTPQPVVMTDSGNGNLGDQPVPPFHYIPPQPVSDVVPPVPVNSQPALNPVPVPVNTVPVVITTTPSVPIPTLPIPVVTTGPNNPNNPYYIPSNISPAATPGLQPPSPDPTSVLQTGTPIQTPNLPPPVVTTTIPTPTATNTPSPTPTTQGTGLSATVSILGFNVPLWALLGAGAVLVFSSGSSKR